MNPVQSIAEILGIEASVRSLYELDRAVSSGLPKRSLVRLAERIYSDRHAATEFCNTIVEPTTWRRWDKKLSRQASEQAVRLAWLVALAEYALNDREQACAWLKSPHSELDDRTPLEVARTEVGGRWVEEVLFRLFFGLPA